MGMLGPLTAQALGRSPYDDVVDGEGDEQQHEPAQQYDYRGRPVNPETRRMNRDIVRSHNEVMLVIGVAEPENPFSTPEAESQRRHGEYEQELGRALLWPAVRCIESAGVFGLDGLRQRILIYKRYSHIPFWQLFKEARNNFSLQRHLLAGAPTSLVSAFVDRNVSRLWLHDESKERQKRWVNNVWSYIRVHLELYAALQRLDLTQSTMLLPSPKFFIPFTNESPMPPPPPPSDFSFPSLLRWLGEAVISTAPFLIWVLGQRVWRDWRPDFWKYIHGKLPSTELQSKRHRLCVSQVSSPPPPPPPSSATPQRLNDPDDSWTLVSDSQGDSTQPSSDMPAQGADAANHPDSVEAVRRPSSYSTRGDDYASDEEDTAEGVSATLISFDVEATESAPDAPTGLWSAELRPSAVQDLRSSANQPSVYLDTMLTRLPASVAAHVLAGAVARLVLVPYEGAALRLASRTWRLHQGLPSSDIYGPNMLREATWISVVNFLGCQLLHLTLCSEIWAVFTGISQWYHMTEEEWRAAEEGKA